ncbi:MAG TPA: VWA domain-containing protein [Gammaproteobacteria bacterium]|nr:VWA domain-containing protein [Gammaproteobacteria bacterium]
MEERIGILWHRLINRIADRRYPAAAVELDSVSRPVALLFRALGGDHGVALQAGDQTVHGARRTLRARLAGTDRKVDLAWVDAQALRLPLTIDRFAEPSLNRELYLWLAALCAHDVGPHLPWFTRNQVAAAAVIRDFPGLAASYRRLVEVSIAQRPGPETLAPNEARRELAIREALHRPGTVAELPAARRPPHPVVLWLRPEARQSVAPYSDNTPEPSVSQETSTVRVDKKRRRAEYTEAPERRGGLLLFRPESVFSWTEYAKVEHEIQENEDEDPTQVADDLDTISIARDQRSIAKKLRMELDLRPAEEDHAPVQGDVILPEWDYRTRTLKPDQCRVTAQPIDDAQPCGLPEHLKRSQRRLKKQFEALTPVRQRLKGQPEANEIDLDPYIRHRAHGRGGESRFYIDMRKRERDLACLLLADLSLSTEASIDAERRVIDVIRDSLFLFSEAMSLTKDRFALYGFSSKRRADVRLHTFKGFGEPYNATVRGRINAIAPAYYTRMGAAIRRAADILAGQSSRERLLLLLTDGKPNDADHYEGRYGVEDTRNALQAARRRGLRPFCVTIDQEAHEYLPHIFGKNNFTIIRKPSELPSRLPLLYGQLTR